LMPFSPPWPRAPSIGAMGFGRLGIRLFLPLGV
jgi:hypothetical protein